MQRRHAAAVQGRTHLPEQRHEKAAKLYTEATRTGADCPVAWSNLGDCFIFRGDYATALQHYEKSISLNPHDYRTHFYRGNALARTGRFAEARDAWAWSLVLNSRNEMLLGIMRELSTELRIEVQPDLLRPRAFVRMDGEAVEVYADTPHWLAFGACKGLWLGDPAHRKEVTGRLEHTFNSLEERECMASLLATQADRKAQRAAADPFLDRLVRLMWDGLLDAFIAYEIASRVSPHATLQLDRSEQEKVKRLVIEYVLSAQPF